MRWSKGKARWLLTMTILLLGMAVLIQNLPSTPGRSGSSLSRARTVLISGTWSRGAHQPSTELPQVYPPLTPLTETSPFHSTTAHSPTAKEAPHVETGSVAVNPPRHRVQDGDSFWKLAEKYLGAGHRWKEIATLNPGITPEQLQAGQELILPLEEDKEGRP